MRFVAAFLLVFIAGTTAACVIETHHLTPIVVSAVKHQLDHVAQAAIEVATTIFG